MVGNELGLLMQVIAVAFGLGAIVTHSATAFTAVKLIGAGYLVYLGMIALVCDAAWAVLAAQARSWLGRSPRRLSALGGASGMIMIGLGTQLALTGRRD